MTVNLTDERATVLADGRQRDQARSVLGQLGGPAADAVTITVAVQGHQPASVPDELASIIGRVLQAMAGGGTLVIGSLPEELTTTTAAQQLGISRPTLMKLIAGGEIPSRKVGTHHRVLTADVLEFKQERLRLQRAALEQMRDLEDELEAEACEDR